MNVSTGAIIEHLDILVDLGFRTRCATRRGDGT
jgi:hypothetical protein